MAPIIIDTDPGLGRIMSDVDDALAIAFAVWSGLNIVGLTSCYGNAPLSHTHRVTQALGERFDLPAFRGAAAPGDSDSEAVRALVAHTGTVIALAPMTNIAAALRQGAVWKRLIVLGGVRRRLPNLRPVHTTEFNFAVDESAAATALSHATDIVPMGPCRKVWFRYSDLADLPTDLRRATYGWLATSPLRHGRWAFHPWDVLATALVSNPELFATRRCDVQLDSAPFRRGRIRTTAGDQSLVTDVHAQDLIQTWRTVVRKAKL